jgi:hypothetical protein
MNILGIQIVALFFALVQLYFTYLHYKRSEFTRREAAGWTLVWLSFAVVTLFPEAFAAFSQEFGTIRLLDFFTVVGFIVVLSISFYTYVNVDRLRKKLEKAVRDLALQELPASEAKSRGKKR